MTQRHPSSSSDTDNFTKWVPAAVLTLFALYVPTFISGYLNEPKLEITETIDVVVSEAVVSEDDVALKKENGNGDKISNGTSPEEGVVAERVDFIDSIGVEKRPLDPLKTLLLGAPNPRSLLLSATTFLINVLLVSSVADRLFREHSYTESDLSFARPGFISENEAKILIREPDQSKMPLTVEVRIKDPKPPFESPLWHKAGGVGWTSNETDFTAVVPVALQRHPKRKTYLWRTSNNHSGEFTAPPQVGHALSAVDPPFTFLSTSCIVNRLPYSPFQHPLSIPGLKHLAKLLPSLDAQFMLFLGDFIYADVPRFWGKQVENYRQKYRQVYASPDWAAVGQNLSWIHVLDDHEIYNDWDANTTGVYSSALNPWQLYNAAPNPPVAKKAGSSSLRKDATYYEFTQGPASFFLLDTRSHRHSNGMPAKTKNKTMLGPEQLSDFLAFLRKPEPYGVKWKIVASSVPFTKNWAVNTRDTWGGFLAERQQILEAMWDAGLMGIGVVILSGDRHEFAATKFPPPEDGRWPQTVAVHEFSTSPLSQFYSPIPTYRQTDKKDVKIKYVFSCIG